VEGSVQNHCLLAMPTGSTLLAIQPPKRFNAFSKTFADLLGINWAYVVAEPDENGFRLSVKRLLETLDVVTKVASGSAMREITV
jgi:hypothetical protein